VEEFLIFISHDFYIAANVIIKINREVRERELREARENEKTNEKNKNIKKKKKKDEERRRIKTSW